MADLRSELEKYRSMRKGFGYNYEHQTWGLGNFVAFMEKRMAHSITMKLAMEWATLPAGRHASLALRLTEVRGFARHVSNLDPRMDVGLEDTVQCPLRSAKVRLSSAMRAAACASETGCEPLSDSTRC
jgi:hypothetical protein